MGRVTLVMSEKIKVMIAEDIDILREDFAEMVDAEEDMCIVGKASCGNQIITLADKEDADVILMDIEMDYCDDGINAAKEISKHHPDIKIVFLTIHEEDERIFNAFEVGAVDYVVKSLPAEIILQSIRQAYAGKSVFRFEIAEKIRHEFTRLKKSESSMLQIIDIISKLTPSEWEIIRLLLLNMKISEIAKVRHVEVSTIKSQINLLLKKFGKRRTKEIVALIHQLNIEHLFQS